MYGLEWPLESGTDQESQLARSRAAAERHARFPWMDEAACMSAMQLVLPDGRVLAGDAAIPEVLRRLRGWRRLTPLFGLPGVSRLAPLVYGWIARNRYRLSCMVGRRP